MMFWYLILKILRALLALPASKKVLATVLTALLAWVVKDESLRTAIVELGLALVVAMGLADWGKEAASIKAASAVSPSLAPTQYAPSASGGVPQAVDREIPRR